MNTFLNVVVDVRNFVMSASWVIMLVIGLMLIYSASRLAGHAVAKLEERYDRKVKKRSLYLFAIVSVAVAIGLVIVLMMNGYGIAIICLVILSILSLIVAGTVSLAIPLVCVGAITFMKAIVENNATGKVFGWNMLFPLIIVLAGILVIRCIEIFAEVDEQSSEPDGEDGSSDEEELESEEWPRDEDSDSDDYDWMYGNEGEDDEDDDDPLAASEDV